MQIIHCRYVTVKYYSLHKMNIREILKRSAAFSITSFSVLFGIISVCSPLWSIRYIRVGSSIRLGDAPVHLDTIYYGVYYYVCQAGCVVRPTKDFMKETAALATVAVLSNIGAQILIGILMFSTTKKKGVREAAILCSVLTGFLYLTASILWIAGRRSLDALKGAGWWMSIFSGILNFTNCCIVGCSPEPVYVVEYDQEDVYQPEYAYDNEAFMDTSIEPSPYATQAGYYYTLPWIQEETETNIDENNENIVEKTEWTESQNPNEKTDINVNHINSDVNVASANRDEEISNKEVSENKCKDIDDTIAEEELHLNEKDTGSLMKQQTKRDETKSELSFQTEKVSESKCNDSDDTIAKELLQLNEKDTISLVELETEGDDTQSEHSRQTDKISESQCNDKDDTIAKEELQLNEKDTGTSVEQHTERDDADSEHSCQNENTEMPDTFTRESLEEVKDQSNIDQEKDEHKNGMEESITKSNEEEGYSCSEEGILCQNATKECDPDVTRNQSSENATTHVDLGEDLCEDEIEISDLITELSSETEYVHSNSKHNSFQAEIETSDSEIHRNTSKEEAKHSNSEDDFSLNETLTATKKETKEVEYLSVSVNELEKSDPGSSGKTLEESLHSDSPKSKENDREIEYDVSEA